MRLVLVATPIGNADDLSPRAREALAGCEGIFCEDSRKLAELMKRTGLDARAGLVVIAIPGDRELQEDWAAVFARNPNITRWALVSDAGTPVVNDPGRGLVEYFRGRGWELRAVPGPSAPVLAWQWSGGFGVPFVFAGFAPKEKTAQARAWDEFFAPLRSARTFCFFDTRHQFARTLEALDRLGAGGRRAFVAREMTKPHEELLHGTVREVGAAIIRQLEDESRLGELTVLIEGDGQPETVAAPLALDELLRLRSAPPKEAAKMIAKLSGVSSRDVYNRLLKAKES